MMSEPYTGHVEPRGPTSRRTVGEAGVEVRKLSVGPMDNNAYVLVDVASRAALLIDAANDAERLLRELDGLDVVAIVTTHGHGDHWQALDAVAGATGAPAWHHPADGSMIPKTADRPADDGARITFGAAHVDVLHTPGHTPGSVCLLLGERHLFSGDTLFPGGPGNTFGNATAFARIMRSLRERLFVLPDDTWVYPGHGDDTTIGNEQPHLQEWIDRGW